MSTRDAMRGSRKHILDWVESPTFVGDLNGLLTRTGAVVGTDDSWMPKGWTDRREARLNVFGPKILQGVLDWDELRAWWLGKNGRGNTPNWDLASTCTINGQRGLVLVEAKANAVELKTEGKASPSTLSGEKQQPASAASLANHEQIGIAIATACDAIRVSYPEVQLSRDRHYQLANRISFAWWLASQGLPIVLLYLGFLRDTGIADVGPAFASPEAWQQALRSHTTDVFPAHLWDRPIECGGTAPFWFLCRSRPVIEPSPPRATLGRNRDSDTHSRVPMA